MNIGSRGYTFTGREKAMKYRSVKRGLDIVLSLSAMLLLLPLETGISLITLLSGEGVICRQQRIGQYGKPFVCYKFRTMYQNTPVLPRSQLTHPEARLTPAGKLLRRWGLDELPQLFNVLKGDMSLIGPRPLLPEETVIHQMRSTAGVYALRPGITGMAQICGEPPPADKAALDKLYLHALSPAVDGALLLSTVRYLLQKRKENIRNSRKI